MFDYREVLRLLRSGPVVRRGIKYAVVVGLLLVMINHGDAILDGNLTSRRLLQMGLTVLVPFAVSAFSSVAAMRDARRGASRG